jgi:hypothetical protein
MVFISVVWSQGVNKKLLFFKFTLSGTKVLAFGLCAYIEVFATVLLLNSLARQRQLDFGDIKIEFFISNFIFSKFE